MGLRYQKAYNLKISQSKECVFPYPKICSTSRSRRFEVTLEPTVGNHGQKFLDKWYSKQKQF